MFYTPSDTRRDAADTLAATLLAHCREVSSVHIFGSVARRQASDRSDIDLILGVDEDTHQAWTNACWDIYQSTAGEDTPLYFGFNAATRLLAAGMSIPMLWPVLAAVRDSQSVTYPLDLLVLPIDWHARLGELQRTGQHKDSEFMQKIDEDAILLATSIPWTPACL